VYALVMTVAGVIEVILVCLYDKTSRR